MSCKKAVEIVEMILDHCPQRCKMFSRLFDEHGRQVTVTLTVMMIMVDMIG
jgi:hypothetical protein